MNAKSFGTEVRRRRIALGAAQCVLAAAIHKSQWTVSVIERDLIVVDGRTRQLIRAALMKLENVRKERGRIDSNAEHVEE